MTARALLRPAAMLVGALAALGSCGEATAPGEPAGPTPGRQRVTQNTPGSREGAVRQEIPRPALPTEVESAQAGVLAHVRQAGGVSTVALFGTVAAGEVLRLRVPDVRAAASYQAAVREVAGEDNALREDLAPYRATVTAPDR
jgi:hypothetical protein